MDILQLFSQLTKEESLGQMAKQNGVDQSSIQKVVEMGLPTLLEAMGKNAKSPDGAKSLAKALDDHKDDPVDNMLGFLRNVDTNDGAKILKHILGSKTETIESKIASQSGVKASQVDGILSQLAPMLLGALGQEKKKGNMDVSNLSSMLPMMTQMLGKQSKNSDLMGMAASLLDSDKDGDIMDDVGDLVKGFFGKK